MGKFPEKLLMPVVCFFFLLLGAFLSCLLLNCEPALAGPQPAEESADFQDEEEEFYELTADDIVYDRQQGVLEARVDVIFAAGDYRFEADKLTLYINDDLVTASGDPLRVLTADEMITGRELIFNYRTGEGEFVQAETRIDEITFAGNRLSTISENGHKLQVEEALYTPCLLPEPHYSIRARKVTVYPEDRVVAEEAAFYWGENRIIALPYYVLEFTEDPDDPERLILQDTGFIYEIGFDSLEGLVLGLGYLYEIGERTEGGLQYSRTTAGSEIREADNILRISDNLVLETEYDYRRHREEFFQEELENEESYRWQESLDTTLTFSPADHTELAAGYSYQDLEGELEQSYFAGWEHQPFSGLTLSQQQRFIQQWQEREEGEEAGREESRPLATSLEYDQPERQIELDLVYDFFRESWRQEYYHREIIGRSEDQAEKLAFSFYHDYHDWRLMRRDYLLELDSSPVLWQLKYREGYDNEFLPYLSLELPLFDSFSFGSLDLGVGLGRRAEEGRSSDRLKVSPHWRQSISDLRGWDLTAASRLTYINHLNYHPGGDAANFAALENEFTLERVFWERSFSGSTNNTNSSNSSNSKNSSSSDSPEEQRFLQKLPAELTLEQSGGLEIESSHSRGEVVLAGDDVDSRRRITPFSTLTFQGEAGFAAEISGELEYDLLEGDWLQAGLAVSVQIPTAAPQSSLAFDFAGEYSNSRDAWQELNFQLERKLDCYSYSFNYEAVEQAFFLGFDLDL